jgi:hypothetical protein
VELWLRQLPLARSSCAKVKNIMSVLFNHARRYELFDDNPIHLVRQSAKVQRSERADHLKSTLPSYSHSVSFVHQQKDGLQFGRKRCLCPSKISKCLGGKELFSLCSSPL